MRLTTQTAAANSTVPAHLAAFRDVHRGEALLVCGCGESINDLPATTGVTTIGVNDIGRKFDSDYLVVVNPKSQFTGDRFRYVAESRARTLFTQYDDLPVQHPNIVRFRLGTYGGTDFSRDDVLHYTQNSPYVALCLAIHMGVARIGLIGVDFTDHHFFAKTGRHPLAARLAQIDAEYNALARACTARGIEIVNLSPVSRLTAFPKMPLDTFLAAGRPERCTAPVQGLKVVSYATTPVAGVPAILARCIAARTAHTARCVWATNDYGNGVCFQGDLEWGRDPAEAEAALANADLVIVHNGKVDPRHRRIIDRKAVVTMAHNYMWNVDAALVQRGFPGVVVGQYQAALPEFAGWGVVPNPLPVWEPEFTPAAKPDGVAICYTPSGKHERYPPDHRLYWHAKGYETTMRALDRLAAHYPLTLEVIRDRQVSHAESLAMKRRSHIVIDECVTGSYHRNSLEGLACGCVVVNGLGLLPAVVDVFERLAGRGARPPFVFASLDTLEHAVAELMELGPDELARIGATNRDWIRRHWDFSAQWAQFWEPAIDAALSRAGCARPKPSGAVAEVVGDLPPASSPRPKSSDGISVIIPHGGTDRLPLLRTCLRRLRTGRDVGEVVLVEYDREPALGDDTRSLADAYVFVRGDPPFHKTRAMNVGLPFVAGELLLWLDGDLLLPADFLEKAITELTDRRLDCLIPWTSVQYLSRQDSARVVEGTLDVQACRPVQTFLSRRGPCGGAVLVRSAFVRRCGGMHEGFRGWGGEDSAWFHRAQILGRTALTSRLDQHLHHLYHENSGGYSKGEHIAANPFYADNTALLQRIRQCRTSAELLKMFPPPAHASCPWDRSALVVFIADNQGESHRLAEAAATALRTIYDAEIVVGCDCSGRSDANIIVSFGRSCALEVLKQRSEDAPTPLLLVHLASEPLLDQASLSLLQGASAHVAAGEAPANGLKQAGLAVSVRPLADPEPAAEFALDLAQAISLVLGSVAVPVPRTGDIGLMIARTEHLQLREFAAFNHAHDYPRMRRWELPFALTQARLGNLCSLLDCTINPCDFGDRLRALHPNLLYRHWSPIQNGEFRRPFGFPDEAFDRVTCINTLEHLVRSQRETLLADLARKLKPGGMLVATLDYYFDSLWEWQHLLRSGVMRADRSEIFNGWNKVAIPELLELASRNGLTVIGQTLADPDEADVTLYRNIEAYPHTCVGVVLVKGTQADLPPSRRIIYSLLTWNTREVSLESLRSLAEEAAMMRRLGHDASIVVVDNGSTDGTPDALRTWKRYATIDHRLILNESNLGSSVARNQVIDCALAENADFLMFVDGDIEIIPFSSYAMLRYMEDCGHLLGCVGANSFSFTNLPHKASKFLFSLAGLKMESTNLVAWTQNGLFRCEMFKSGVRFDEAGPFAGAGWGFEDNDLAFQIAVRGYCNQRFYGVTYLHRDHHSSIRIMQTMGLDPRFLFDKRKSYLLEKWSGVAEIENGPLTEIRAVELRL